MNISKLLKSFTLSTSITSIFIVVITIAGELYKVTGADGKMVNPIKDLLKALHGHHWVGKGVWAIGLFFITGFVFYFLMKPEDDNRGLGKFVMLLSWVLIVCTLALYGFFTYEYLSVHA
ncbi:MAG: hypothetical protein WAW13_02035 [Minisyncoccia bacterium]